MHIHTNYRPFVAYGDFKNLYVPEFESMENELKNFLKKSADEPTENQ